MNSKETLKKLHKRFPLMTLDELFDILDCYVENSLFNYKPETWYLSPCNTTTSTTKPENCLITKINYTDGAVSNINTTGNIQLTAGH